MSKHFELTDDTIVVYGQTLYRIRATRDSFHAMAGEVGGYVWGLDALHNDAWVSDKARVSGKARVYGEARVSGEAQVYGKAWVSDKAWVYGEARVSGEARVYGKAWVSSKAHVESALDVLFVPTRTSIPLPITVSRQKGGSWLVRAGCWAGTVDELAELVARNEWVQTAGQDVIDARPEMEAVVAMIRARIARVAAMKGRGDDE